MNGKIETGARQAVSVCLKIKKKDMVVIITDSNTKELALALVGEINRIGCKFVVFEMEQLGSRPLLSFPKNLGDMLNRATASIYIAGSEPGELEGFRRKMIHIVELKKIRHAHMVGVTEEIMRQGMNSDYQKIRRFNKKLMKIVTKAREIEVSTARGTDLTARFSRKIKWVNCDGQIKPGHWNNLPEGEVFTCVDGIEGRIVVDGVLGDYFSKKFGLLEENPVDIQIKKGRICLVSCSKKELEAELLEYIKKDRNANRIGEFALGTNLGLKRLIGNLLQDEKFPGVHIAAGHGYPERTRSGWSSKAHLDMVIKKPTISVNGKKIMERGVYNV